MLIKLASFAAAVALAAVLAPGFAPGIANAGEPSAFWADPNDLSDQWVAAHPTDGRTSAIRDQVSTVPQGRWFTTTNTSTVRSQVDTYVGAGAAAGKIPIVVVYDMPNRDCGGASAGGAATQADYRAWIDQVALGIAGRPAAVIVEPDVLAQMTSCQSASQQADTEASMAYAGTKLKGGSAQTKIYFDAGNSAWIAAGDMANRLRAAGVTTSADGISTNISNFRWLGDETTYAKAILSAIGASNLKAVIDTSRDGNGPTADSQWCDPTGRKVGPQSTDQTGDPQIAAWLWVKPPGEADGCAAAAGTFDPQVAYDLAFGY